MPQINGEWVDHEDLERKVLEVWSNVADKMRDVGAALGALGDKAAAVIKVVDQVSNEFDALGPLLDALAEDDDGDEDGRDDVEDMEG